MHSLTVDSTVAVVCLCIYILYIRTYVLSLCIHVYICIYVCSTHYCMCRAFCRVRKNLAQCPLVPMEFIKMTTPPLTGKGKAKVRPSKGNVHLNLLYVYTYVLTYAANMQKYVYTYTIDTYFLHTAVERWGEVHCLAALFVDM